MTKSIKCVLICFLLLTTGCNVKDKQPTSGTHEDENNRQTSSLIGDRTSTKIEMELADNLSVNLDIVVPKTISDSSVSIQNGSFRYIDGTQIPESLVDSKKIVNENARPSFSVNGFESIVYTLSDESELFIGENTLTYQTDYAKRIRTVFNMNSIDENYNASIFDTNRDVSFDSIENAKSNVISLLSKMNIEINSVSKVYSLNHSNLQQEESKLINKVDLKGQGYKAKESWSSDDDSYYMLLDQSVNGISVASSKYGRPNSTKIALSEPLEIIYSNRGIELFSATALFETKETGEATKLINIDAALKVLKEKYDLVILTDPTVVTQAELVYLPVYDKTKENVVNLVPAWQFVVEQTVTDQKNSSSHQSVSRQLVFIDAITGKEII